MATINSCDCPSPPGGRVECDPNDAAVCYVNEQGEVVGKCIRLDLRLQTHLQNADEMEKRLLLSHELSGVLEIPLALFQGAEWISQSIDEGMVFNIRFSPRSSINVKLPGLSLSLGLKRVYLTASS